MSLAISQIRLQARAELERRKRLGLIEEEAKGAPDNWYDWLMDLFPAYVSKPFAQRHRDFWEWVWSIRIGIRPKPFIAIWPREGGKSSSAELAVVAIGARGIRPYVWYVRETQDQADINVTNIMDLLETSLIETYYPLLGAREMGKFGRARAWRRNRLRTASGFVVDAIGFDTAVRGAKIKQHRPGLIILDDIDNKHDTHDATEKKITTLTTSILPSGSQDVVVLAIQNLMIEHGVFSRLAGISEYEADFLINRIVSGPYPAVDNLEVEKKNGKFTIVAGEPTWEGQSLEVCQENMDTWGYSSFMQEAQHEVEIKFGGIWDHIEFRRCNPEDVPDLVRGAVWCDPVVTETDNTGLNGISASGIAEDGTIYRLYSWEGPGSPRAAIKKAILICLKLGFSEVGFETDQGGDLWMPVYYKVWTELVQSGEVKKGTRRPAFRQAKAGISQRSKVSRNKMMLGDYEKPDSDIVHVRGNHTALERALYRFPIKPLDLADAAFWDWHDLRHRKRGWSMGMSD